jgi:hypothetical protein
MREVLVKTSLVGVQREVNPIGLAVSSAREPFDGTILVIHDSWTERNPRGLNCGVAVKKRCRDGLNRTKILLCHVSFSATYPLNL